MSKLEVDAIEPQSGTTITIGSSGDTVNLVGTLNSNGSPLPGDISSVVAGTGLSGGGTTGAVTLNIEAAQPTITSLGTITGFTSTGIDDNANALAITISSAENVGIGGTPSSTQRLIVNGDGSSIIGGVEFRNASSGGSTASIGMASGTSNALSIAVNDAANMVFKNTGGTERMRISSAGLVGIGTSSPSAKLELSASNSSGTANALKFTDTDTGTAPNQKFGVIQFNSSDSGNTGIGGAIDAIAEDFDANTAIRILTGAPGSASERMRITSAGNVGIGETVPLGKLHVKSGDSGQGSPDITELVVECSGSGSGGISLLGATNGQVEIAFGDSGDANIGRIAYNNDSNFLATVVNASERMRILSNGNVGIGKSDPTTTLQVLGQISLITPTNGNGMSTNCIGTPANYSFDVRDDNAYIFRIDPNSRIQTNNGTNMVGHLNLIGERGQNNRAIDFENSAGGGTVGDIRTASSSVAYNTSSDYRLKENVDYTFDATTRLKQLKPARFNFKIDADTTVDGFIAHEVSSIIPEAITGTKDAVKVWTEGEKLPEGVSVGDNKLDDDGNTIPDYQGIDQSKLVPLLVKTIQELEARITTLENA